MARWQSEKGGEHDWVSGVAARYRDEMIELNRQWKERTGEDFYLYTSRPGDGQTRVVFTDCVVQGYVQGLRHMEARIALEDTKYAVLTDDGLVPVSDEVMEGGDDESTGILDDEGSLAAVSPGPAEEQVAGADVPLPGLPEEDQGTA